MSLSNYNPHRRYKERAAQRFASAMGMLAIILIAMLVGFWLGKQYGAGQLIKLKDEVVTIAQERDDLEEKITDATASAQTAQTRYKQLQEEVESIIPAGPMQDLVTLVREQLKQGMDPERLSFVIRSARPPTGCVDPETKRIVVSTPAYKGPESVAVIADGLIKINGSGKSARNADRKPEAWYDPSKRVEILFRHNDKMETKRGILPVKYSVVVADREYRFTIESGARSFAKITYDSCAYP